MPHPHHPIIYVRGYAMTQGAIEETVGDPYMGFNVGSTKVRQQYPRTLVRHIFESPLVRLMKDEGYTDSFLDGNEIPDGDALPERAVWIYRYYESASKDLGTGDRSEIEEYAQGLLDLIDTLERRYATPDFKVYLVAHSMGGLICRCLLQKLSPNDARVDKVFTYATPHGGIDVRGIGNVPGFLGFKGINTFSEAKMREYLALPANTPVQSLNETFPEERFFSLVGTNHEDYSMARFAVGPSSDGLVRIQNAYALGTPRAFVHRSHSGHYGIVNSEDGYQNLRRFLFGNVRVDAFLDIDSISLPSDVQAEKDAGKPVRADYHVDVIARVRSVRWDLHRRTVDEGSAVLVEYAKHVEQAQPVHLASTFLHNDARANPDDPTLGFSLDLAMLVPEYQVGGRWWNRRHYDGAHLFRDKLNLEARRDADGWHVRYGWDSESPNLVRYEAERAQPIPDSYTFGIPVVQKTRPGLSAVLRLVTRPWNEPDPAPE
jgi:pimeloyl-ACP methyl ester carboxylesterase